MAWDGGGVVAFISEPIGICVPGFGFELKKKSKKGRETTKHNELNVVSLKDTKRNIRACHLIKTIMSSIFSETL
jgi:hypothetical protein